MHKSRMNRAKEYVYSKTHERICEEFATSRKRYLEKILVTIQAKRVLVLGCGEGSFARMIKTVTQADVYGIDYSRTGIKLSKEKKISVVRADLNKGIPFPDNNFDLVISDQLLEHINNTDYLLQESYRVLKKSGYTIVITPNLSCWMNRILFPLGLYPIFLEVSTKDKTLGQGFLRKFMLEEDVVGHIRVFNLPALTDMLQSQKFKIVNKTGIPLSFDLPMPLKPIYSLVDGLFAKKPSLARDILVVARKG